MNKVTLSHLIHHLKEQLEEHGNLPVYCIEGLGNIIDYKLFMPEIFKIYTDSDGVRTIGQMDKLDKDLDNVDTSKPITKGLVL